MSEREQVEHAEQGRRGEGGERANARSPEEMLRITRQEIGKCVSLLEEGSEAAAAVRLTRLKWDLDSFLGNETKTPWSWVRVHR